MKQQIDFAAENGLSFFAFDWYYPEGPDKETPLNTGLKLYLDAPNRDRLEFCLLVANHGGFRIRPADWETVCAKWIQLFKNKQHLCVGGKPLLIFFSPRELLSAFGGPEGVRKAFDSLRDKATSAGLAGVSIAACSTPGPLHNWSNLEELANAGFDLFTGYNYHGHPRRSNEKIQAFRTMMEGHQDIWDRFAARNIRPYIPVVTVGWDKRPWEDAKTTATQDYYYPDRTAPLVEEFVSDAVNWLDQHPQSTVPERLILLYAWNENGEGGYLTPTKSMGEYYLKAVSRALRTVER